MSTSFDGNGHLSGVQAVRVRAERKEQERPVSASPQDHNTLRLKSFKPDIGWKWWKWTFGFWRDVPNHTAFGIDFGPLEVVWRYEGYRP